MARLFDPRVNRLPAAIRPSRRVQFFLRAGRIRPAVPGHSVTGGIDRPADWPANVTLTGREPEVVLDPARRARLAAQRRAFHDQRLQTFGCPVDRRSQAGRTGPDHDEIDLLARGEFETDPQHAGHLAAGRVA
jgi:hypothetical protein